MDSGTKLAMVIFMQKDLEAAVAFYQQLGLVLVFHIKERWAEFDLQGIKLGLCPTQQEVTTFRTGIVFEVKKVQEFYEQHKGKLPFINEPTEAVHGIMVSIKDPGGNILDLYQPTPEKAKEYVSCQKQENALDKECCKPQEQSCC